MLKRITHSGISFGVVLAAYWVYALAAALLIEPVNDTPHVTTPTRDFAELEQQLGQHYRAKIGSYFPEGHWALDNPKVLEGENGMLLVRDYQPQGDDIVELKPCAMIFFPRKREGTQPQSEAVILEAPQGALLEFEKGSDLSHARLGKLVHGQLRGEITIRGEMREPGPQDDLELITYDVQLNNKRIWTEHDVKFRLGPHYGEGKRLEIRLRPPEQTGAEPGQFGEVEAIQLTRDVQMHIELEGSGLIPESPAENEESQSSAEGREDSAQLPTPVEITCKGPFEFDLVRLRASFEQQVDVLRVIPTGPSDQLNCEYLAIHFETDSEKEKKRSAEEGEVPPIRPTRIEAEGRPVIVRSPSSEGHVRCERLAFDLIDNELTLEADREVMMFQGVNEIHAPALKYRPSEYRGGVPLVWAAGPGWLRTAPGEDKSQIFQLRWNQELHLRPHDDAHVLSISGRPQMRMTELGQLTSDEVHFWLREKKAERDAAQKKDEQMVEVQPDRMMAEGEVQVESPQLTGATERLELWFQQVAAGPKTARTANSDNDATKPDNRPVRPAPAPREAPAESRLASEDSYDVRGKLIRLQVQVADRENMQVTDLAIDGDVKLRQTKMATPDEQPLWIEGDRLQMADADGPNAQVAVTGQPAKISVRGLTLEGKAIELDRATNQVKIDGAGMMKAPIDRDLEGRRIEKTEMLSIDFSGGMNFDGQTIRFERDVVASTQSQKLRTMFLDVSLRERVDFGGSVNHEKVEINEIVCSEPVEMESRTIERGQLIALDRINTQDMRVNQSSGRITASGPGWVSSVRRAGNNPLMAVGAPPRAQPVQPKRDGLEYLRADFQHGIEGNLHDRAVALVGNVKCVYGPVKDWQQTLSTDNPDKLGESGVILSCDRITLVEVNPAQTGRGTMEMEALGNTLIEGSTFTARANRVAYAQAKDLIVLEGTGQTDAHLWRQTSPGAPMAHAAARKIMYWRSRNSVEVDDARFLDLSQFPKKPQPQSPSRQPAGNPPTGRGVDTRGRY